jgi:hypothetical protein
MLITVISSQIEDCDDKLEYHSRGLREYVVMKISKSS